MKEESKITRTKACTSYSDYIKVQAGFIKNKKVISRRIVYNPSGVTNDPTQKHSY